MEEASVSSRSQKCGKPDVGWKSTRTKYRSRNRPQKAHFLTSSDLKIVRKKTYEARAKWYDIGLELGLPEDTLECIKKDCSDINSQFRSMYSHWLKMVDPKPSWEMLIEALEQVSVGEYRVADILRQKFCPKFKNRLPQRLRSYPRIHHAKSHSCLKGLHTALTQYRYHWPWILLGSISCVCIIFLGGYIPVPYNDSELNSNAHSESFVDEMVEVSQSLFNHSTSESNPPKTEKNKLHTQSLPKENFNQVFHGRDAELNNIAEFLKPISETCIISITGPPGFGKSTLAIHAGFQAKNLGYTVVYADIAELTSTRQVKQKIIRHANFKPGLKQADIDVIEWATSIESITVLILDNCDTILYEQTSDFQSFLKSICKYSMLKVVITAKQVTLFLGMSEHIQLQELQHKDAVRVLTEITPEINSKFAHRIAEQVGNVPLALQIVGMLLKAKVRSSDELLPELQQDIIEALSPEEVPVEDHVNTTMYLSYQHLDKKFQVCACILSNFPGTFLMNSAHFVLSNVTRAKIYNLSPGASNVWTQKDTKQCLRVLTSRSLLTFNDADQLYKFHQLVKEFFQHVQAQREQHNPHEVLLANELFKLSFEQYTVQKFQNLIKKQNSTSPDFLAHIYYDALKEISNHKHIASLREIPLVGVLIQHIDSFPSRSEPITTLYFKKYKYSLLRSMLGATYAMLLALQMRQSEYLSNFGAIDYFDKYVSNLIYLGRMETYVHNTSYALQHLLLKSNTKTAEMLYRRAIMNDNSTKSYNIYADYYATLAKKYIRLKDFKGFVQCWQKVLYLRVFKTKCENRMHKCTRMQQGLSAFSRRHYDEAILHLSPYLNKPSLNRSRRARIFVIVCYSHITLDQQTQSEKLIKRDFMWLLAERYSTPELLRILHDFPNNFKSISEKIMYPNFYKDIHNSQQVKNSNSRSLLIYGTFLEKYSAMKEIRLIGTSIVKRVALAVRYHFRLVVSLEMDPEREELLRELNMDQSHVDRYRNGQCVYPPVQPTCIHL